MARRNDSDPTILVEQIRDAYNAVMASGPDIARNAAYVLPAVVSARITAGSLGGLLKRLFGSDPLDLPFVYQCFDYPIAIPASTVAISSDVTVSQDSDFYAQRMGVTIGNDGTGAADFRLNMQWGNNDRRYVNSQAGVHAFQVAGSGQRPFIFPNPIYLPANARLTVTLTSITSTARSVFVDLLGRKAADVASLDITTRRS